MEHNLDFGAEAQANHALAVLRAQSFDRKVASGEQFSPGVFVLLDEESDTSVHATSQPGTLLDLSFKTRRPSRWLSLNIQMGECDLTGRDIAGFMCKVTSEATMTFRVCVRSGHDGGFQDAFFGKRVISYSAPSTHADLMKLAERDDVPAQAPWRELMLFLPPDVQQISLKDLALFGV